MLFDPQDVWIRMDSIAESPILFDYVYGVLGQSGVRDKAHNLAHMMESGLCDKANVELDLGNFA